MRWSASCAIVSVLALAGCERAATHERRRLPRLPVGAIGGDFCVVLDGGRVACSGSLAVPPQSSLERQALSVIPGPEAALQVTVLPRSEAACAVTAKGDAWCWGVLADAIVESPVRIEGLPPASAVAATQGAFCALAVEGTVWCWSAGDPTYRQFDQTLPSTSRTPIQIEGLPAAKAIAGGAGAACVLVDGGAVWCWGDLDGNALRSVRQVTDRGVLRFHDNVPYGSSVCVETRDTRSACLNGGRFEPYEVK